MKLVLCFLIVSISIAWAEKVTGIVTYENGSLLSQGEWNELISGSQMTGGPLGATSAPDLVTSGMTATWTYTGQEVPLVTTREDALNFLELLKTSQALLEVTVTWSNIIVGGSSTPVTFPDAALEAAILAELGRDSGPVTESDLLNLEKLSLRGTNVTDLTGLEKVIRLEVLDLTGSNVPETEKNRSVILGMEIVCLYLNGRWTQVVIGNLEVELADLQGNFIIGYLDTSALSVFDAGLLPLDPDNATNQSFFAQLERLGIEVETTVENYFTLAIFSGLQGLDALPNADPNNNGVPNLLAHALGLPLSRPFTSAERSRLPAAEAPTVRDRFGMNFTLPADAPDDVVYIIEEKKSLADAEWTEIARRTGEGQWAGTATVTTSRTGDVETVTIVTDQTFAQEPRSFLRLTLELVGQE